MEFYQTIMGKRFFEGQVPHLIKSLDSISASLSKIVAQGDAIAPKIITKNKIQQATQCLVDNGIEVEKADAVMKDLYDILLREEG